MNVQFKHKFILVGILVMVALLVVGCGGGAEEPAAPDTEPAAPDTEPAEEEVVADTPVPTATTAPTKPPEPTATTPPEMTPTSTPEADPRNELGNSAWGAVFEDDTQTWFQYDNENSSAEVRDNKLVLTSYKANSYDNWSMSYAPMTDFYLELRFTTGPECAGKDRFGIFFRAPDPTHGYLYMASCDGAYLVREWNGDEFTELIGWTLSEHIVPGPEVEHRLGVWAEGDQYKLYVNGFQVGEFSDDTYTGEGTFGAAHAAAETENFFVDVTEAKAWELP
jgi:hypothetical protein